MIWCKKCRLWRRTEEGSCRWCHNEPRLVLAATASDADGSAEEPAEAA